MHLERLKSECLAATSMTQDSKGILRKIRNMGACSSSATTMNAVFARTERTLGQALHANVL